MTLRVHTTGGETVEYENAWADFGAGGVLIVVRDQDHGFGIKRLAYFCPGFWTRVELID